MHWRYLKKSLNLITQYIKNMKRLTGTLLILILAGCNQPKIDVKAEGEKVIQTSKDWSQAASTGNVAKTVSHWADEAVVMSPGQPPLKGREAIRQMVEESYKIPGFRISWQPQSVDVSVNGDMAYLIENSQVSFTDSTGKAITHYNKGVSIWKKQADGTWKNVVDISTPDPSQNK